MLTIENGVKPQREDVNNINGVKQQSNILNKQKLKFNNNQKNCVKCQKDNENEKQ